MTTQEIIDYYANLLMLQYLGETKAYETIQAVVLPSVMDQLPTSIMNAFEIGTAVGPQLDTLAEYVGVLRSGVGVYQQPITLDDADFTQLIRLGIITNNSGSSLYDIDTLLQTFFPNQIFAYDGLNMQMSYLITASIGSEDLVQMFVTQGKLPKPMAVQLASLIFIPTPGLFSLTSYANPITDVPVWSALVAYNVGNQVYSAGVVYASAVNGNLNHAVSNASYWTPLLFPLDYYDSYSTYTDSIAYTDSWTWLSYADTITIPV